MRRTLAVAFVAAALALPLVPAPAATAAESELAPAEPSSLVSTDAEAQAALDTVAGLLDRPSVVRRGGAAARAATPPRADVSLAMRDLFVALPRLTGDDRTQAEAYLARPTDGANDRFGDGYDQPSAAACGKNVCVHYVPTGVDAPPSPEWVSFVRDQMNKVWKHEVKKMGYRAPISDKSLGAPRNGGNGKFDVYLKDIGGRGLYGYCAPEYVLRGQKWRANSYCVLDNDFATAQFGTAPKPTLRATAAHEFFHAVQFSYDFGEDKWFMESTATWMEERYADNVNDNRQYLPSSQLRVPYAPLDVFSSTASNHYGNWIFWEYLTQRFGNGFVRKVWETTSPKGRRNTYAIAALKKQLQRRGGFAQVYRTFAAANLTPQRTYREGKAYPSPVISDTATISKKRRTVKAKNVPVNHLSAVHLRVRPDKSLASKRWRLKVTVSGPARSSSPSVVATVKRKNGSVSRVVVPMGRKGGGSAVVPFSKKRVSHVTLTLVNASTRFRCYNRDPSADPQFSCEGTPRDDGKRFTLKLWAMQGKAKKGR